MTRASLMVRMTSLIAVTWKAYQGEASFRKLLHLVDAYEALLNGGSLQGQGGASAPKRNESRCRGESGREVAQMRPIYRLR